MEPTDPPKNIREPILEALTGEEKRLLYELERELWFEQVNGRPIMQDGENKKGRPR